MKKIIITGASGGIGRALVRAFASPDHILLITGYSHPEVLKELSDEYAGKAAALYTFTGDLSDYEEICRLFSFSDEVLGTPDLLINNAGIARTGLIQDAADEDTVALLNTDLLSCMRLSKECAKRMLKRHSGRILNVSSVHGLYGASCEVEYSACKGGINAFTKALAKELAPSHIQVNAIAPGAIDTEMNGNLSEEEKAALSAEIPAGRFGRPEEVAEMLLLLSRAPDYLTGQVIQFDGGWM